MYHVQFSSKIGNQIDFYMNEDSDFGKYTTKNNEELFMMDYLMEIVIPLLLFANLYFFEIKI